jgi:MFS family permease
MTVHAEAGPAVDPAHRSTGVVSKPVIFAPLFAPFGISSGYVGVTLAFLLDKSGLTTAVIGTLIAIHTWPQTVKMLWAPFVDTIGNPKVWYGIGAAIVGLAILLMSTLPKDRGEVPVFIGIMLVSSVASTFISMSTEIFMANQVPPELRGRASGWSQAGNLGGSGIGGGIGLLLATNFAQPWISGAVLAAICIACWGATLFLPHLETVRVRGADYLGHLKQVFLNVWEVARSRLGYLGLIIMILPIGSGGVPWAAIADEWHAGANTVAFVNGFASGGASIVGALAAGYVCDRMDVKKAYSLFGVLVGLVAVSLIALPRTPSVFVYGVLAYQAMVGMTYTAYAAIVLEAIGKKSAATNWNLMAALSNIPIAVMSQVDGNMHDAYGTNAMLLGELVFPVLAMLAFWLFVWSTRRPATAE